MKDLAETKKELANALMDASKNEKQCELLKKERDELQRTNAAQASKISALEEKARAGERLSRENIQLESDNKMLKGQLGDLRDSKLMLETELHQAFD